MKQTFKSYSSFSRAWAYYNGVRVRCFDSTKQKYNPDNIYLIRVSSKKIRIVNPVKDKIRNCLEISGNPDLIDREYLENLIISKLFLIDYLKHGSCQPFINKSTVLLALSGAYTKRGQGNKEVLFYEFAQ